MLENVKKRACLTHINIYSPGESFTLEVIR